MRCLIVRDIAARVLIAGVAFATSVFSATVSNPLIWSDVPDISVTRGEGANYYMVSTTMHYTPGVPIMHSSDLANWRTIGYAYESLVNNDKMNLENGQNAYGNGSWASSIRYHKGKFYILTPGKTSGKSHLYTTDNIESGKWKETLLPFYHDPSLFFDSDGSVFIIYGSGTISYVELTSDASAVKSGGRSGRLNLPIEATVGTTGLAEGSHMEKINGKYYLFMITWPSGGRTEAVFRSSSLSGTYEGKIFLKDNGIAQGSIFETPEGKWYGYLFKDNGGVGRIPYLMEVTWNDGWPAATGGKAPSTLELSNPVNPGYNMVTSDDFEETNLPLEWQWNHNPDKARYSLTGGKLKITTGRVDQKFIDAKNTLTMRTFGPKCSGRTLVSGKGMKEGDRAGLVALADSLGFIALEKTSGGYKVVQYERTIFKAEAAISQDYAYFRIDFDFQKNNWGFNDKAKFYYSADGKSWKQLGNELKLPYTLGMFVGYRFGLFDFATKTAGGYAEFDWFKVGVDENDEIKLDPIGAAADTTPQTPYKGIVSKIPGVIQAENYDDGKQNQSYYDASSSNEGGEYRTDGVDVVKISDGYAVGYTMAGEWMEYTLNVDSVKAYQVIARISSGSDNSSFRLYVDGEPVTDTVRVANGGDWDTYREMIVGTIDLSARKISTGSHVLKIEITGNYVNLDWIKFQAPSAEDPAAIAHNALNARNRYNGVYSVYNLNGKYQGKIELNAATSEEASAAVLRLTQRRGLFILKNATQTLWVEP